MLRVTAFQIGNPVLFLILMIADYATRKGVARARVTLHERPPARREVLRHDETARADAPRAVATTSPSEISRAASRFAIDAVCFPMHDTPNPDKLSR